MGLRRTARVLSACAALIAAGLAHAEDLPLKIGLVAPVTGPFASTGRQIINGAKTYLSMVGASVAGRRLELVIRDDAGIADNTKRVTQELIVNDKVAVLAGYGLTPLAMSAAPLATQAKIAMVVMGAGTSAVTEQSPYIVRTSFAQGQSPLVMGEWAARNGMKTAVTLVSDFAPGYDTESTFRDSFAKAGGRVLEALRAPLSSAEFTPYLQRAADAHPDALFVFIPAGQSANLVAQFVERGLPKSGMTLIGAGDVTDDDMINGMSDQIIGTVTAHQYSAAHDSDLNRAFVRSMKANFQLRPNFFSVGGFDGMRLIAEALRKTNGVADGPALVEAMKGMSWESPRGPVTIDPQTRDIIQNIYVRRVERVDGELYNVEFETVPNVKDPVKAAKIKN